MDRGGRLRTPVDSEALCGNADGLLRTLVDGSWGSTDQKVGGSSPSGRAAEIPCSARDFAYWPASSTMSGPRLVRIWSARASLRTSSRAAARASMSDGKRCP